MLEFVRKSYRQESDPSGLDLPVQTLLVTAPNEREAIAMAMVIPFPVDADFAVLCDAWGNVVLPIDASLGALDPSLRQMACG